MGADLNKPLTIKSSYKQIGELEDLIMMQNVPFRYEYMITYAVSYPLVSKKYQCK